MNKTNQISRIKPGLLNLNNPIYDILANNPPQWWLNAKEDPELYIEVRKNNEIMIYYKGGRVAGIKYNSKTETLSTTAHPKYLGLLDKTDTKYYRKDSKHTPIYQPCEEWLENKMEELKKNIVENYSGNEEGEDTSEKFIQGSLILNGRKRYIDSEFAHRFRDGEKHTIRIDLVRIEDGRIVFEELKRIGDNRMRTTDSKPEILTQMQNYRDFLSVNSLALAEYYKELYRIKLKLELPIPYVEKVDLLVVDKEPQLIIANNYNHLSEAKIERIRDIESILQSKNIVYSFI